MDKNIFANQTLGNLNLQTNLKVHNYDTNKLTKFIVNDFNWNSKEIFSDVGIKTKLLGNLKNIKKSPNVEFFSDKKKFFNIDKIDIYIISTPTKTHFEYISYCLSLNKFVCVTKPFTSNFKEVLTLQKKFKNTFPYTFKLFQLTLKNYTLQ